MVKMDTGDTSPFLAHFALFCGKFAGDPACHDTAPNFVPQARQVNDAR
jgi:hypothetical protein